MGRVRKEKQYKILAPFALLVLTPHIPEGSNLEEIFSLVYCVLWLNPYIIQSLQIYYKQIKKQS